MDVGDIRTAIRKQMQVTATFNGHRRRFCPHILGTRNGEWRVLAWQFAGGSESGLKPGGDWRCFGVADLKRGVLKNGDWHRGWMTGDEQSCVDTLDTVVAPAFAPVLRPKP